MDVSALYPSVPHQGGLSSLAKSLNTRPDHSVPTDYLVRLMRLVLTKTHLSGMASSTRSRMVQLLGRGQLQHLGDLETDIMFQKIGGDLLITSCFGGWVNLVRNHLSQFCEQLSSCHQVHMGVQLHHQVCDLPRLDLTIWVDAKNSYLLPSSNHPSHITKNIPNSLSLKNHEELWPGREEGVEVSGAVR